MKIAKFEYDPTISDLISGVNYSYLKITNISLCHFYFFIKTTTTLWELAEWGEFSLRHWKVSLCVIHAK
jgi:hypothetical protein